MADERKTPRFTPGPWVRHSSNPRIVGNPAHAWVAKVYTDRPVSDADLIAAAPELYEALAEIVYETTHLSAQSDDGSHNTRITRDTLALARVALAAARGER